MRRMNFVVLMAICLGVAWAGSGLAVAQEGEAVSSQGKIFGFQDARTGVFHPATQVAPEVTAAPTTGTITATLTIKLASAFPTGYKIVCSSVVSAISISTTTYATTQYDETASNVATVSGTTATCAVKIPYSWTLPAASTTVSNSITGSYEIFVYTAGAALPGLLRSSSGTFLNLTKVPSVGTATNVAVNVTL